MRDQAMRTTTGPLTQGLSIVLKVGWKEVYAEIREIDPLSVIVPISKIRKPHLPIGLNIWNTLYRADVPSKKWFRIVFREDQPSTKEQARGGPGTGMTSSSAEVARGAPL